MLAALHTTYLLGIGAGLLSAICLGAGDFYIGDVASRSTAYAATSVIYIFEFFVMGIILLFQKEYGSAAENLKMLGASIAGNIGFVAFVYGLAKGKISIVAPLAALLQLVLPLIFSIYVDKDTLSKLTWAGIIICIVAIIFITFAKDEDDIKKPLFISLLTGSIAGLSLSIWVTGTVKIDTPLVSRLFIIPLPAAIIGAIYLIVKYTEIKSVFKDLKVIVLCGLSYGIGVSSLAYSGEHVTLLISTLLISLIPAVTIALAKFKKNEQISRHQYLGFLLAAIGVIAIAIGL